jgi:multidrug resistance protein, MATE family
MQTTAAGALRGLNDTRIPLLMAFIGFWVLGFLGSYVLAFIADQGPVGIWIGLALSLTAFALLLTARFHVLARRGFMPN